MSTLSTNLYGSATNKGMGGLLSGLDTDDLVNQMTAATRNKINREYQSKQKLLYRQEAYREISTKLLSFSNKYFSYSSGSANNILSPKFFESYTYKPSSNYVNVTGNAENIKNFSINEITSVATAASFNSTKKVSERIVSSKDGIPSSISPLAGETMTLEFEGKSYDIKFGNDFGENIEVDAAAVAAEMNEQLKELKDEEGNQLLTFKADGNKIVFDEGKAKLTAASSKVIDLLNFKVGQDAISTDPIEKDKLNKSYESILQNKNEYITFEYNGVLKTINLNGETDSDEVKKHLQDELNKAFGEGKINVTFDTGKLSFEAKGDNNIFGISSISKDLSRLTGLESGDYNRLNRNKPLAESGLIGIDSVLKENADGKEFYRLTINGVNIDFETTMSVTDVINKINSNAEAGVRISYSSTTDTFTVKATATGSHKGVSIDAGGGTLAQALFGSGVDLNENLEDGESIKTENGLMYLYDSANDKIGAVEYDKENREYKVKYDDGTPDKVIAANVDYHINKGTDTKMAYTLNGVKTEVIRSTANFTIDEINIELNENASSIDFTNAVTFDVTNNSDEVVERVKQFINEYNEIISLIGTKTGERPNRDYPPLTPEQQDEMKEEEIKSWTEEAKKGVLYGDSKMNNVLRSMRSAMSGFTDVSSITLSNLGISAASMDTSGKLMVDEKKLKEMLLENPDEIANLFTSTSDKTGNDAISGIAVQLQQILKANIGNYGNSGLLIEEAGLSTGMTADKNFISEKIEKHDEKMEQLKKSLEKERQRYWNQFSALEQSLNKLNAQSSWLTDMMGGN